MGWQVGEVGAEMGERCWCRGMVVGWQVGEVGAGYLQKGESQLNGRYITSQNKVLVVQPVCSTMLRSASVVTKSTLEPCQLHLVLSQVASDILQVVHDTICMLHTK